MERSGPRMAPARPRAARDARPAHKAPLSLQEKGPTPPPLPVPDFVLPLSDSAFAFPDSFYCPVYFQETLLIFTFAVAWSALLPGLRRADQG